MKYVIFAIMVWWISFFTTIVLSFMFPVFMVVTASMFMLISIIFGLGVVGLCIVIGIDTAKRHSKY